MIDFKAAMQDTEVVGESKEITPLDEAKRQLVQFSSSVVAMRTEASSLVVKDEASAAQATAMRGQTKTLLKRIADTQDNIIAEPQAFVKAVQSFTLPFRKTLEEIDKVILKPKLEAHAWKIEQARRIAEAEARKAAEAAQKKIDREAKKAGVEAVQLPTPVIPVKQQTVRTESGTSSTRFDWDYEVRTPGLIPDEYLLADPTDRSKVMAAIKAGVREIAGLRIFEKPIVSTRRV